MRLPTALLVLLAGLSGVAAKAPAPGKPPSSLADYIGKEDKSFEWKLKKTDDVNGTKVYALGLVSQTWHDVKWEHDLLVIVPKGAKPQGTMLLWNQGGTASASNTAFAAMLAEKVGLPIAFLFGVPKQPLYVDKNSGKLTNTPTDPADPKVGRLVEDALIAETFVRFLSTQDDSWPLLFPMVKSVVRAMDAVQAFAKQEWKADVEKFVITGASKRGWTSWLTAASGDKRVKAIAPMVIDTLNFPVQMKNQVAAFGEPSEMIADYTRAKLVPIPDTSAGKALWQMVDPHVYCEKITVPKMLIHGTNDPYWPQDAMNTYWDDLKGDKYVCYVPNAGHNLREKDKDGKEEMVPLRAVNTLAAFARSQILDKPMPTMNWTYDEKQRLCKVEFNGTLKASRVWTADASTRDFRKSHWTAADQIKGTNGGVETSGSVSQSVIFSRPDKGLRAAFVEIECDANGCTLHLTTQIQILEAQK